MEGILLVILFPPFAVNEWKMFQADARGLARLKKKKFHFRRQVATHIFFLRQDARERSEKKKFFYDFLKGTDWFTHCIKIYIYDDRNGERVLVSVISPPAKESIQKRLNARYKSYSFCDVSFIITEIILRSSWATVATEFYLYIYIFFSILASSNYIVNIVVYFGTLRRVQRWTGWPGFRRPRQTGRIYRRAFRPAKPPPQMTCLPRVIYIYIVLFFSLLVKQ